MSRLLITAALVAAMVLPGSQAGSGSSAPEPDDAHAEDTHAGDGEPAAEIIPITLDRGSPDSPWRLVRALEELQNSAALEGLDTRREQQAQMQRLSGTLQTLDPSAWQDARNVRAALVFVLAGGDSRILVHFGTLDPPPPVDPALVTGIAAHVGGQSAMARRMLAPVDPYSLPRTLGAHVALARATLTASTEPAEAQRLLALARVLMPRTLVAEAAARRELRVLAVLGQRDRFVSLTRRYFRTFGRSIYAGQVAQALPEYWVAFGAADAGESTAALQGLVEGLPEAMAAPLYADVARRYLIIGQMDRATGAARLAAEATTGRTVHDDQAAIYTAAARIAEAGTGPVLETLDEIDPETLDRADRAIRLAALAIGRQVMDETPVPPAGGETGGAGNAVAERVTERIAQIDTMLREDAEK